MSDFDEDVESAQQYYGSKMNEEWNDSEEEDSEQEEQGKKRERKPATNKVKRLRGIDIKDEGIRTTKKEVFGNGFDEDDDDDEGKEFYGKKTIIETYDDDEEEVEESSSAENDNLSDDGFKLIQKSNPYHQDEEKPNQHLHTRNQKIIERELLGIRIRLQKILKVPLPPPSTHDDDVNNNNNKSIKRKCSAMLSQCIRQLLELRLALVNNATTVSPQRRNAHGFNVDDIELEINNFLQTNDDEYDDETGGVSFDLIWSLLVKIDAILFDTHREIIEYWERRALISTNFGKKTQMLKTINKSIVDQCEAIVQAKEARGGENWNFEKVCVCVRERTTSDGMY